MSTLPVKFYDSLDSGAPTVAGQAGNLITLLDACLVNGYNANTILSITRNGSTATVSFSTAHGYRSTIPQVIAISGADQSEYNGEFFIGNVTANTFDITITGTPATPATGSIFAKVASLNWTKVFSGTNKAVYKSDDPINPTLYIRVDDTTTNYAEVRGYESMTDVDTGTGMFPLLSQQTYSRIYKSTTSDATLRPWRLFGDTSIVYLLSSGNLSANTAWTYQNTMGFGYGFGNILSFKAGDAYSTMVATYGGTAHSSANIDLQTATHYAARNYWQTGTSVAITSNAPFAWNSGTWTPGYGPTYPSPVDGSFMLAERWLAKEGAEYRGIYPGKYFMPQKTTASSTIADRTLVSGVPNFPGKTFLITASSGGGMAFDLTGPWR